MDDPKPKRAWWRRKRWRLAFAFWLVFPVVYAAGLGPAYYCHIHGWVSSRTVRYAYKPLHSVRASGVVRWPDWYRDYLGWWITRASRDRYGRNASAK